VPRVPGVEVRPVRTRRELREFIRLPWRLYRASPQWVPPLLSERRRHLDRRRNPFFEHADAEYFLAWRSGQPVGRISAHVDHRLNQFQGNRWGLFGFFEAERDAVVTATLLDTADDWLRARQRDRMIGPFDFSTNHECGVLVEGHQFRPQILENWHHPYYRELLEGQGMVKAMDLYKWEILREDRGNVLPVIYDLADRLEPEHGIRLRRMRKRAMRAEMHEFIDVYNSAWSSNWGFVPLTDEEIKHMAKELRPVLDEDFACVAETADGQVAGVCLSLPDFNFVLDKPNGRLLPLGWLTALRAQRRIDEIRVFALGVKPEYQHTGVAAAAVPGRLGGGGTAQHHARGDRLDPRDQPSHEPCHGGLDRPDRQALPDLRALARARRSPCVPRAQALTPSCRWPSHARWRQTDDGLHPAE
jgi:hypothetical protein